MIDAHTHLYSEKYDRDLEEVIKRARKKLAAVIISSIDSESLQKSLTIKQEFPESIYLTAGIHPRKTAKIGREELWLLMKAIARSKRDIVALGEVGPDFYHIRDPRQQQRQLQVLEAFLAHAEKWKLPLVVHARQAESAALEVLAQSKTKVMFHCFAGSRRVAGKIADHGFYISFSAILLGNPELQVTAAAIPRELILTETDSPALSPLPDQSRNEPVFVEKIVSCLAQQLKCSPKQAAKITEENAQRFYGLPPQPET